MLEFVYLKKESYGGYKSNFYASTYNGGVLLKVTTFYKDSVTETITNIPMAEIYQGEAGEYDIRMMNFALGQVGVDLGIDFGEDNNTTYSGLSG
jgi:hypothetical protein